MIAATICSGIGAPEVAMAHWSWTFASEIESAPRAIMAYRHGAEDARQPRAGTGPALWGDFTAIRVRFLRRLGVTLPQWIVAGTPCQSFSVAGLRGGMADARGNLTMEFLRLVHALRRAGSLRGFLWENVPGILSHTDNPFGCFLAGIVGSDTPIVSPLKRGRWPSAGMVDGPLGKAAWRVSDAQYFGLAQRRARIILVASFVDGVDPAAVLFERRGLSGNNPPRREAGKAAPTLPSRSTAGGGLGTDFDCDGGLVTECFGGGNTSGPIERAACLTAKGQRVDFEVETFVTHALRGEGFDASADGTGRGTPLVPVAFSCKDYGADVADDLAPTLRAMGHAGSHANAGGQLAVAFDLRGREGGAQFEGPHDTANIRAASGGSSRSYVAGAVGFAQNQRDEIRTMDIAGTLAAEPGAKQQTYAATQMGVRRLLPVECERLQGFPDHFTAIPYRWRRVKPDEGGLAAIEGCFVDDSDPDHVITNCMADGPRYKALGNSMPVDMIRYYLQRVEDQAA